MFNEIRKAFKKLWRRLTGQPAKPRVLRLQDLRFPVHVVRDAKGRPLGACCGKVTAVVLYSTKRRGLAAVKTLDVPAAVEPIANREAVLQLLKQAKEIGWRCVELDPTSDSAAGRGCITRLLAARDRKGA